MQHEYTSYDDIGSASSDQHFFVDDLHQNATEWNWAIAPELSLRFGCRSYVSGHIQCHSRGVSYLSYTILRRLALR